MIEVRARTAATAAVTLKLRSASDRTNSLASPGGPELGNSVPKNTASDARGLCCLGEFQRASGIVISFTYISRTQRA